ncbi:hypothetical protein D3C71_1799400 [compost metagenome]
MIEGTSDRPVLSSQVLVRRIEQGVTDFQHLQQRRVRLLVTRFFKPRYQTGGSFITDVFDALEVIIRRMSNLTGSRKPTRQPFGGTFPHFRDT